GARCHDRPVDVTADLVAPCTPDELFRWVDDLGRYPQWLEIVPRVRPADPHPDDPGPAWSVDLRGRLGPFARSKRLRMVRTVHEPGRVRFERAERDGRRHAPWVLTAEVGPVDGGSRLEVHLHYGGSLVGPLIERLLGDEIERSRPRLLALVGA
ncbi:MAG TPA: SRPBCC family protein, partial [Acidimicrobiales bacterium]|nr:SRPBCC family protein [Acidimicrobiales bacterium]